MNKPAYIAPAAQSIKVVKAQIFGKIRTEVFFDTSDDDIKKMVISICGTAEIRAVDEYKYFQTITL